ncbi:hypothetical protein CDAR_483741 [Caerostris darwini]|uniref:MATH domain-containing protein n=1 Tax=Caerostris darwini TaxID=1538125 RepID=A0AAV4TNE8_9ARAC|nr:hypothetical protein CDAR_483741 [Caerostris darwini]
MSYEIKDFGFVFKWNVENIIVPLFQRNITLISPTFEVKILKSNTRWYMTLYPDGLQEKPNYIGCILHQIIDNDDDEDQVPLSMNFKLSLIGNDEKVICSSPITTHTFKQYKRVVKFPSLVSKGVVLKERELYLPKDSLTLHCHMWLCQEIRQCIAHSHISATRRVLVVKIEEFSAFRSKTVLIDSGSNDVLELSMKFERVSDKVDSWIKIIFCMKKTDSPVLVVCRLIVLNSEEKCSKVFNKECGHLFNKPKPNDGEAWEFPANIYMSDLRKHERDCLSNDMLSLRCEFIISKLEETSKIVEYQYCKQIE